MKNQPVTETAESLEGGNVQVTSYMTSDLVDFVDNLKKLRKWTRSIAIAHLVEIGRNVIEKGKENDFYETTTSE